MNNQDFLVVAIGASAGGIKALNEFFRNIPAETRSAFIVVTHLLRDHVSKLDQLIRNEADLPVIRVDKDMSIESGNIYVMPENAFLTIEHGRLKLQGRDEDIINKAIDIFFDSVAKDCDGRTVGIVLSGLGSDGLKGVKKIEDNGGIVFVQDPDSTRFDGMPVSIIKFNHPDVIATPAELAKFLVSYELAYARGVKNNG